MDRPVRTGVRYRRALILLLAVMLVACSGPDATNVPDASVASTASASPQARTAAPLAAVTSVATGAATPTATPTPTPTALPSSTPSPTPTVAPSPTATSTPLPPTATVTPSPVPDDVESAPVIVLDPGHDPSSGGALGIEYQDTLRTALATKAALETAGYAVHLTRPDNEADLLDDPDLLPPNAATMDPNYVQGYVHTSKALQLQPDLYISLHYNASPNPDAAGLTIYYCDRGGPQNAELAAIARDELVEALHALHYEPPYATIAEDGAIGKVYGHLATLGNVYSEPFAFEGNRLADIPTVLTEPLFETNPVERALIQDDATHQAFADALVRAVNRYFGR